jgi:hypothetical protein
MADGGKGVKAWKKMMRKMGCFENPILELKG